MVTPTRTIKFTPSKTPIKITATPTKTTSMADQLKARTPALKSIPSATKAAAPVPTKSIATTATNVIQSALSSSAVRTAIPISSTLKPVSVSRATSWTPTIPDVEVPRLTVPVAPSVSSAVVRGIPTVVTNLEPGLPSIDSISMPTQSVPKAEEFDMWLDTGVETPPAADGTKTSTTTKVWSPTDVLSTPWAKPQTVTIETEGYVSAKDYHDKVVAQLPGLDLKTQDMITLISGFAGIKAEDVPAFMFSAGLDKKKVTSKQIENDYVNIKQKASDFVKQSEQVYRIQSITQSSQTDKIAEYKLLEYIDKVYPDGLLDGSNRQLVESFPQLAMTVFLGINSPEEAKKFMAAVNSVYRGGGEVSYVEAGLSKLFGEVLPEQVTWQQADMRQKEQKLAQVIAAGELNNINPELIAATINELIFKKTPTEMQVSLWNYVTSGEINTRLLLEATKDPLNAIWQGITSEKGADIIGVVAAGASVIGGGLVLGPAGAIAGAGMAPFQMMEIKNYTGFDESRLAAKLKSAGIYPPEVASSHDFIKNDIENRIKSLQINADNLNIDQIEKEKAEIEKLFAIEKESIEKDAIPLIIDGSYSKKKDELTSLEIAFKAYKPKDVIVTPLAGIKKEVKTEAIIDLNAWAQGAEITVKAPEGIEYKFVNDDASSDKGYLIAHQPGKHVVEFYKDNALIGSKELSVYDSDDNPTLSLSQAEIEKWTKTYTAPVKSTPQFKRTVLIPAGSTLEVGGKQYAAGSKDRKVDITANEGHTSVLKFTQPGKDTKIKELNFYGASWDFYQPELVDSFKPYVKPKEVGKAYFTGIPKDAVIKIDGQQVNAAAIFGIASKPGEDKSVVVSVKAPGYEERNITVYIKAGETQEVSLVPTKQEFKPYESEKKPLGGGGGGGGYYSGGRSAESPGQIIFGETCRDAVIIIDAVESAPVIGQAYTMSTGYHSIVVKKVGYSDFSKTVYIMDGEILTFNAALTAGKSSLTTTGPGPVQSPDSGKIIFGEPLRGATIYLDAVAIIPAIGTAYDLAIGYHSIKINKPGYVEYNKTIYIMSGQTLTVSPSLEPDTSGIVTTTGTLPEGYGAIRFGTVLLGATITLDGSVVTPQLGSAQQLTIGYHGITIRKTGYKDYNKNVYIAQDQILEFSPVLESDGSGIIPGVIGPGGKSYRVTFTSNPEGAKIMIGKYDASVQDFTGQWTPGYVDLYSGLYSLRLYRSGYIDQVMPLWVGEQSFVGTAAIVAAEAAGVI